LNSFYATRLLYWAAREDRVDQSALSFVLSEMEAYPEGSIDFMMRQTPLHAAAISGSTEKLQILIEDFLNRRSVSTNMSSFKNKFA